MDFPSKLKYSKDHEWIEINGETAIVGVTDFAQGELGDIVFVDINTIGQTIKQFDIFGSIEAVKTVSDLFLPVSGTILEVNPDINNSPQSINTEPYTKGWIVKISLTNPSELDNLLDSEAYKSFIGK